MKSSMTLLGHYSHAFAAEDESNGFEIYSLKLQSSPLPFYPMLSNFFDRINDDLMALV